MEETSEENLQYLQGGRKNMNQAEKIVKKILGKTKECECEDEEDD